MTVMKQVQIATNVADKIPEFVATAFARLEAQGCDMEKAECSVAKAIHIAGNPHVVSVKAPVK